MRTHLHRLILAPFLLACAAPSAAATKWEPLPPEVTNVDDCPAEPGCAAAMVLDETFVDNAYQEARIYHHRILRVFKTEGLDAASFEIPFVVGRSRVRELEGRTIHVDGSEVPLDTNAVVEETAVKGKGFRRKVLKVQMPAVQVGSYLEYRYRLTYKFQIRSYAWYPQGDWPVVRAVLTAEPGAQEWKPFALNMRALKPAMDADEEGHGRIIVKNIPARVEEPMMPPRDEVEARILLYPAVSRWDWDDLGRVAHEVFDKYYKRSKAARKLAEEIAAEAAEPEAKLEKIYRWVQENIDNTAYQETAEGEVRDEDRNLYVDDVLSAGQGSPDDLARLLAFLAREAGLEAEVALISTRDESFFHKDVMDLYQFTAEITAVRMDDAWSFYDPGTRYCPLGLVGWENEGVWENALVTRNGGGFLSQVPPSAAEDNVRRRSVRLALEPGGAVTVDVKEEAHGLAGVEARNRLDHLGAEERRSALEEEIRASWPDAKVEALEYGNLDAWWEPLRASYRLRIDSFAVEAGSRLLVPATVFPLKNPFVAPQRRNDVYYPRTAREVEEVTWRVPEGYEVESLPRRTRSDLHQLLYDIRFEDDGGEIHVERELVNTVLLIAASKYANLRALYEKAEKGDAEQIVLQRAAGEAGP